MRIPAFDRRRFLALGTAGVAAASLPAAPAFAAGSGRPLYRYDLAHLYALDLADPAQAAAAYDELHLVSAVQGIVNRDMPRLYVHFVTHSEFGSIDIDEYWFGELQKGLLSGRPVRSLGTLEELLDTFAPQLSGSVVWDPHVPSTSNVASTVAGADDLVPLRYDPDPASLYGRFGSRLPARVRLVRPDGQALFTGSGTIPGTQRASSGSAKCDAYLWAVEKYLATGRSTPDLGYFLDAAWLSGPQGKLPQCLLSNHDYPISRRGFVFDLQPWDDEAPNDDPGQPLGTDQRTLQEILRVAYEQNHGDFFPVHGFVPWGYKYTSAAPGGSAHGPVATEWRFVQIASSYNSYLDADAENLDAMANASVFQHVPLQQNYPQKPRPGLRAQGFLDADGNVLPKRYVMFYVGDYDSAAWLYEVMPYLWDDPARGSVPLNWAFNPNLAERMPLALERAHRTATDNDVFIAGDSGAGYINPGMLTEPREFSGLPDGVDAWRRHCLPLFARWDLSVTGFIIDGNAPPMNERTLRAYSSFSRNGFAAQKIEPEGLIGDTPYVRMGPDLPRASAQDGTNELLAALSGDLSGPPDAPEFHSVRTILESPSWHRDVAAGVQAQAPDAAVQFVDALTFYALVRASLRS